jgi:transposase InsO family protein
LQQRGWAQRDSNPRLRRATPDAERPNLRWVADITEFPTGEGKLDLAAIRDLCHRGIVGWAIRHATDGSAAAK